MTIKKLFRTIFVACVVGASLGGFALAGDIATQNVGSRFTNFDPGQSDHYKYYFSSPSQSYSQSPNDSMYDGQGPDLFFPNGTTIKIWRNGVITQCNDWGSLSTTVPQSQWVYIFKNNDGCVFGKPPYLKKDKPVGYIDAQIHYDINWGALDASGPSTFNGRLYYRPNLNTIKCYPNGNTVGAPTDCPSGAHKYWPDDNYGGNHDEEVIDYEIFRCGDGIKQTGISYDNGATANEVCDPGLESTCKSDCSGYQQQAACIATNVTPPGNLEVGQTYQVSCQGQGITAYKIDVSLNGSVVQSFTNVAEGQAKDYTPTQAGNYQFQCIPTTPPNVAACPKAYRTVVNPPVLACISTVSTPAQVTVDPVGNSDEITVTCNGQNALSYKVDVVKNNVVVATLTNPISFTPSQAVFKYNPSVAGSYIFNCRAMGANNTSEDCPADTTVVNPPAQPNPVCQSLSVTPPGPITLGQSYTLTCQGSNFDAMSVQITFNGQTETHELLNTPNGIGTYVYTPTQIGSYNFACIVAQDDGDSSQCNIVAKTVNGGPVVCGPVDGDTIYDFDDQGNSLTPQSPGLCPAGATAINFVYNPVTHKRTWKCQANGVTSPVCQAQEQWCGDGQINGNEQCDDGNTTNNDACSNQCTTVTPPPICGPVDGDIIYDFDDQGNSLTQQSPGLCPVGTFVDSFVYNPTLHKWTWKCKSNGLYSPICQAQEQRCGDGQVNGSEQCDDGNTNNNDACSNQCTTITTQAVCLDTVVTPTSNVAPGGQYSITCLGQGITTFKVEVQKNSTIVQTIPNILPNVAVTYTVPLTAQPSDTFSFQCIPTAPPLPANQWCDKEYRGVVNNQFECTDATVTPSQVTLDVSGASDLFTVTCYGVNVDSWKVDVINAQTNQVITSLMNPVSSSPSQAVFTYNPSQAGNYKFSCWAMKGNQADDCPIESAVVTIPTQPGICGPVNASTIYDFNNQGDSLTQQSPGLCPVGSTVTQFAYNQQTHQWTWKCQSSGGLSPLCKASEAWCGDGKVNDPSEQCDDGNQNDNDGCTNQCKSGKPSLHIEKSADKTTVVPGETVVYTISFWNNGDSIAHNVVIADELPNGYTLQGTPVLQLDPGQGNGQVSVNGKLIKASGFSLAPGKGGTLKITVKIDLPGCGECNAAYIEATNASGDASLSHVYCESKLLLDKKQKNETTGGPLTDDIIKVKNGDIILYSIVFGNDGAPVSNESLIDTLPDEVTLVPGSINWNVQGSASVSCAYNATLHHIACLNMSLGQGAKVTLTFKVTVSNAQADDTIINVALLHNVQDSVTAVLEPSFPDGTVVKDVDKSEGHVGDSFTFTIVFTNTSPDDSVLTEYKIIDFWPAELGLVSYDDTSIPTSQPISVETLPGPCISYPGGSNCAKKIIYMFNKPLAPGQSVEITLVGKGLIEAHGVRNRVEVRYKDDHGNDRDDHDDDDVPIDITPPAGKCDYVDTSLAGASLVTDELPVIVDVYCYSDGNPADTIEIDCGNGDGKTFTDLPVASYACSYTEAGEYFAQCFFNGEPVAQQACVAPVSIDVDNGGGFGPCGDGKRNIFESCDLGEEQLQGPVPIAPDAVIFALQPWITWEPYPGTQPTDYVCDACQLKKKGGGDDGYCYIHPDDPQCQPEEVKCFQQDVTMSVMKDEVLPFWWDIESDVIATTSACNGPDDEGKIIANSLKCSFDVEHANKTIAQLPVLDCYTDDWGESAMFQPFEAILQEGIVINPGRSFFEVSKYIPAGAPLGEYKIKLNSVDFDYCGPDGQVLSSYTENCCMANFALTDHYLMQIGTVTSQDAINVKGNIDVRAFEAMDGASIFETYNLQYYKLIEAKEYQGGEAVTILVDNFVKKYDSLAVGSTKAGSTNLRKVPGKNIFVADGSITISESSVFDGPFTLIVLKGDLVIEGNVLSNGMFVVPDGKILFSRAGLCDGDRSIGNYEDRESVLGRQVVNGIFIAPKGFGPVPDEDPVSNTDLHKPWCFGGGLVIEGVVIGPGIDSLIHTRRSDLYRWFWENDEGKQGLIYGGASVLIEQNPSLWIDSPDGLDELENVLKLYRD